MRTAILEALAEPDTAANVARRLNVARQNVNYHLKLLEQEGLVELVEERRKGNCVERLVRSTQRSWLLGAQELGQLAEGPLASPDRFSSAFLIAVAARTLREVSTLRGEADAVNRKLATFTLDTEVRFRNARERTAFVDELGEALAALVAKYHDAEAPGGRVFRVLTAAHPAQKGADHGTTTGHREGSDDRGTTGGGVEGDHRGE